MATQTQIQAVADLHAFGNRTDVQTEYPKEMGYDITHTDPYELRAIIDNTAVVEADTKVQAVSAFAVTTSGAGELTFTWDDSNNNPNNIESYAIYIWSSGLQDGKHYYIDNDGTQGTYVVDVSGVTAGDYEVEIQAEPYASGIETPKAIAPQSPITVT